MSLLVAGSVALDTVKTPIEEHGDLLGGSASYAAVAASYFTPARLVGIVGTDFPKYHIDFFRSRKIDLDGLQVVEGKTFRWSGEYFWDLNTRQTRSVELNVFENFSPDLPASYRDVQFALLGNIAPSLQLHVHKQLRNPKFVIADTMDLWISTAKEELLQLISKVDLLILNDGEARQFTEETSLIRAGNAIRKLGPNYVAIKKGEHGCLLFGPNDGDFFSCGAYPLEDIHDPTGAGDTFAGGLAGYLAAKGDTVTFENLKKAVVLGSMLASFNVESFSMLRMRDLTLVDIERRCEQFKRFSDFEKLP